MSMNIPERMKTNLDKAIAAAIRENEQEFPAKSFMRNTALSAETVIKLMLTMTGGSLSAELHNAGIAVTKSAFSKRRKLVPCGVFEDVFRRFNALCTDNRTYKGYRVYAIDGTAVNMARNPDAPAFMQHDGAPQGYNQFHVNPLYDVLNKTYFDAVIQPQPQMDEIGALLFFLTWYDFPEQTLIVADRGYESYAVFASFMEKPNVNFLIRVRSGGNAMKPIATLPMKTFDTDASFTITTSQRKIDKENGYILVQNRRNKKPDAYRRWAQRWPFPSPFPMTLRVLRFPLNTGEYETLVTNLPRNFTLDEIRELYHARWGIENAFRELKYSLNLTNLHGKSDKNVRQEIWAAMTMANFCGRIAGAVELPQKRNTMYAYQVNASMAVRLCKEFYRTSGADGEKLMRDIAKHTEPVRPGRQDVRNLKAKSFVGFCYRVAA